MREVKTKKYKPEPWATTCYAARDRCVNPNNNRYHRYGGRGIKVLMAIKDFKELWFRDKAYLMGCASIDRIDKDGDYVKHNCQYIELVDNIKKDLGKPVIQKTLKGEVVKRFNSVMDAERDTGILNTSIANNLSGKSLKAGGCLWEYA